MLRERCLTPCAIEYDLVHAWRMYQSVKMCNFFLGHSHTQILHILFITDCSICGQTNGLTNTHTDHYTYHSSRSDQVILNSTQFQLPWCQSDCHNLGCTILPLYCSSSAVTQLVFGFPVQACPDQPIFRPPFFTLFARYTSYMEKTALFTGIHMNMDSHRNIFILIARFQDTLVLFLILWNPSSNAPFISSIIKR